VPRVLRLARAALAPMLVVLILLSSAPGAYSQVNQVTATVRLYSTSVGCYGSLTGSVNVINSGDTSITVTQVHVDLTDTALSQSFGSFDVDRSGRVTVSAHSSESYSFSFSMTGGTTKQDPEPATATAEVSYNAGTANAGSAGFSITGCTLHDASSLGLPSPNAIPEFPFGAFALVIFTLIIAASYLLVRQRATILG
jgi:hypothetical protein